ncbi:hypothetical protein [Streptomyces sp. AV19]|uniref:hypothetical protein n=1 Tax=Streptomyces sp. AV19 TaxID=2793068 RepID=UPI002413A885|nr:hypothetical protein [Streptomyces sp. AV19]MDG4531914.1 hypothetical protein [Streptomyces sp. AV19]
MSREARALGHASPRPSHLSCGRYATLDHPGARWLVSRATRPREIHEAWAMGRTPGVEAGRRFDVVHLPAGALRAGSPGSGPTTLSRTRSGASGSGTA